MSIDGQTFLTAEWRDLLMLNYEVDPACLSRYVPQGTQLDSFQDKTYLSLVGFRFCRTKFRGYLPVPFHSEFEGINLRFYVRRTTKDEVRRGVVFIAEIVPSQMIAKTARWVYGENYVRRRMQHRVVEQGSEKSVEYSWRAADGWCTLRARTTGEPSLPKDGSLQQFISEHYWGYSTQKNRTSLEYRVEHVPWKIWTCSQSEFAGNPADLYGDELSRILRRPPDSAFVADGSPVSVLSGQSIT
jgi:uncharacterized protein